MRLRTIPALSALLIMVGLAVFMAACDSSGPTDSRPFSDYEFFGALLKDPNVNTAWATGELTADDTALIAAVIEFGGDTLVFDSVREHYIVTFDGDSIIPGAYLVGMIDPDNFGDTVAVTLPNHFQIEEVFPANRIKGTADRVQLQWTGSFNAQGYCVAAVKRDSAYMGTGYSRFVTSLTTSATFSDSAFSITTLQGLEPDPGWYYLYVYSYWGSPDSAQTADHLPVPFPNQLGANIDEREVIGHVGAVVVTPFDSVEVIAEAQ